MRFYIDGNNMAGAVFGSGGGEVPRERIFLFLQGKKLPKQTTIVFDGPPFRTAVTGGPLRMIFSGNRSADELILSKLTSGDIVVTNDNELASRARVRSAGALSVSGFMTKIEPKAGNHEKPVRENDIEGWMKIFSEPEDGG